MLTYPQRITFGELRASGVTQEITHRWRAPRTPAKSS